jgi:hypothetical protein
MNGKRKNLQSEKKYPVNCPYCWAENEVKREENFKVVISQSPITRYSNEFSEVKTPFWRFWSAFKYPKGARAGSVRCENCGRDFYVGLFPYNSDDSRNSKDLNYYLKLAKGETEIIKRKFLLEDILDRFCNLLHINYPIGCFLFILIPCILFWVFPVIVFGGLSKISHDYGFLSHFVLFVLMLIFLKHHCKVLKEALNYKKLPLLLSEQYKTSNFSREAEEAFKGWIFGHPFQRITPPTFCGLVAVAIFLIWQIYYIISMASTFYETPYLGSYPFLYTSYMIAIISIPFWTLIWFIIGNILWIFAATTAFIGLMTRYMPLKIDPLKEMGGIEIFGRMMLSSVYPMAAIGVGIPIMIIWSVGQEFYVLLICILLVFIFMFLIAFGFFYPLLPLHTNLKAAKEKERDKILSRLSLSRMIDEEEIDFKDDTHSHLLLFIYDKILSMREWPFKSDTLAKACSSILVPFISLLINIAILFLKP